MISILQEVRPKLLVKEKKRQDGACMNEWYLDHTVAGLVKRIYLFDVVIEVFELLPCGIESGTIFDFHLS